MYMYIIQVQVQFYSQLAAEFSVGSLGSSGLVLRERAGVRHLLGSLREHYSVAISEEGERERRAKVRSYVLLVVKTFVTMVQRFKKNILT